MAYFLFHALCLCSSNCVVNLSPDKEAVLREAYRVLKPGGELYFSDVYSDRRIPKELAVNEMLWGECLSGALYWNDFLHLAKRVGFTDPRLVSQSKVSVGNREVANLLGNIQFQSSTYRLFKLPDLDPSCEDYGQAVIYKGGISTSPHSFSLDQHHVFPCGKVTPVCRNTFLMLNRTRFRPFFEFVGAESTHYGIFAECGSSTDSGRNSSSTDTTSCCQ